VYDIGWRVFLDRFPALISRERRRRLVVVGVVVALVVVVGMLAVGLLTGDFGASSPSGLLWVVGSILLGTGVGFVASVFVPVGPSGWAVLPLPGIGWRTQEAIARYYRRSPPPVAPEHRDAVLDGMPERRDVLVRATFRGLLLLVGWALALLGVIAVDVGAIGSLHTGLFLIPFWPLVSAGTAIAGIRTLGRQEQLRVEAGALPPVPPPRPPRGRPGTPSGSKLSLPGE
jgi:hypothetical protein